MRVLLVAGGFVASWICAGHGVAQLHAAPTEHRVPDGLPADEARIVRLYHRVRPSVVRVLAEEDGVGGRIGQRLGTGVLVAPACHVLTAAHVVDAAASLQVQTHDGHLRPAEIVFSEPDADVALLRLKTPDPSLPHADLGDSERLAVGQRLLVIGNPRGLTNSLSVGHISGFRAFGDLYDGSIRLEFIQTDAAINSGNSGGPVFDSAGRVVGIASRILTHSGGFEGIGFVVSINTARQLLALEDRAWTGFSAVFLSSRELADVWNIDAPGGLLVQRVTPNSPAASAGLRGGRVEAQIGGRSILLGGDLVLEVGDQQACHAECLAAAHERLVRAQRLPMKVLRGGRVQSLILDVSRSLRSVMNEDVGAASRPATSRRR